MFLRRTQESQYILIPQTKEVIKIDVHGDLKINGAHICGVPGRYEEIQVSRSGENKLLAEIKYAGYKPMHLTMSIEGDKLEVFRRSDSWICYPILVEAKRMTA